MIEFKKIKVFLIMVLIIPILVLIGFSTWIITNKLIIKPDIEVNKVLTEYLNSQEGTYNGNVLLPNSDVIGVVNNGRNTELTYYYKEKNSSNDYIECVDSNTSIGPINAGEYLIQVKYTVNDTIYTIDNIAFKINKAIYDMSNITFNNTSKVYNRENQIIEYNGTLPKGVTVTYTGFGKNVGEYTITASFSGDTRNYEAIPDKTAILTITPKDISECRIYFSNVDITTENNGFIFLSERTLSYIQSGLTIKDNEDILNESSEYTIDWNNCGVLPGSTNTANISGTGNYTGTSTITYKIEQPELIVVALLEGQIDSATYDGNIHYPSVKVITKYSSTPLTDYTLSYDMDPINAGQYNVKVTASKAGYLDGSSSVSIVIYPASIKDAVVNVSSHSDNPNFFVYNNGNEIRPSVESVVLNGKTLTVNTEYNVSSYSSNRNACTNAAIVTVKGTGNYTGEASGSFSIQKATPIVTLPTFIKNTIIEGEKPTIKSQGVAKHNNVNVSGTFTSSNINNITFTVGTNPTSEFGINYSFIPSDTNNFNSISDAGSVTVTVYGVGYNSSNKNYYGTIEKGLSAAASGQTLWVVTKIYENTGFYPTIKSNCAVGSGITLALTYKDGDYSTGYKIYNNGDSYVSNPDGNAIGACLKVNNTATITINGTLLVGGYMDVNSITQARASLMNNGIINFESGSIVKAYGNIKGIGNIYAKSGSTVYDAFRIYDFPGARYAAGMYYKTKKPLTSDTYNNIMPFNCYSLHNISCPINIYYNCNYFARYQLNVSNTIYADDIKMFGSNGFFNLTTDNEGSLDKGYIRRTIEDTTKSTNINSSFSSSNQDLTQREVYEIYSNIIDNEIHVSLKILTVSVNINTSTDLAMPIGLMKLIIKNGYTVTFSKNSYKFLPGSLLQIDEGGKLLLNNATNTIFYDEYYDNFTSTNQGGTSTNHASFSYHIQHKALYNVSNDIYTVKDDYISKIIVNGTLEVQGGFGGLIETNSTNGKIIFNSNNATINRLTSIKELSNNDVFDINHGVVYQDTQYSRLKMYNGESINSGYSTVAAGTYYSIQDNYGNYGWRTDKLNISYDLNGGSGITPDPILNITVSTGGYTIQSTDIPSDVFTREYYEFIGWALDGHGNSMIIPNETIIYASSVFYAIWNPIPYSITYHNVYYNNCGSGDNLDTNPNPSELTIESAFNLGNPTNGNYLFDGWYTDPSCNSEYRITSIQNMHNDLILYAHWFPEGTKTITIKYNINVHSDVTDLIPDMPDETIPLVNNQTAWQPMDLKAIANNNNTIQYYFEGWYFEDGTDYSPEELSSRIQEDNTITTVTLKIYVKAKLKVTYVAVEGFKYNINKPDDYYIIPGSTITLASGSAQTITDDAKGEKKIYTFSTYSITGMTGQFDLESSVQINSATDNIVTIKPILTTKSLYKISYSDSKKIVSSITYDGTNVTDGMYVEIGKVLIVKLKNVGKTDTANSLTITNGSILEATFTQAKTWFGSGNPKEFTYTWSSFKGTLIISS